MTSQKTIKATVQFIILLVFIPLFSQNPAINYKAVIKDANGGILHNTSITIEFSILQGVSMTAVYRESHTQTTDSNGIIIVNIGEGIVLNGDYNTIAWGSDAHFLNTKINIGSGLVDLGTTEFTTVPYALFAQSVNDKSFDTNVNIISNVNQSADFVLGSTQLDDIPTGSSDNFRMFFNKTKGAFRAGHVSGDKWDDINVGEASAAFGRFTMASELASIAMGDNTESSGFASTAMGSQTDATEFASTAMGGFTIASGIYSTAMGISTLASGSASTAMGDNTVAIGDISTAMGHETEASGVASTAMGYFTDATGENSTAMGNQTEASGDRSTAMGHLAEASGIVSTAMGYQTDATGDYSTAIGYQTTASGYASIAMGEITEATGGTSTAMGSRTIATADYSTAMGDSTEASGHTSTAMGDTTIASGTNSTAMGSRTEAIGDYSTTMGSQTIASGDASVAMGRNNIDRLDAALVIGNGVTSSSRSNTFVVTKTGDVFADGALVHSSDRRLKKDITPLAYGLNEVLTLTPVSYTWKKESKNKKGSKSLGLIAQDVQPIIKDIVHQNDPNSDLLSISYTELIPVLINAIKEQQLLINDQELKISRLEVTQKTIKKLVSNYDAITSKLTQLEAQIANNHKINH